MSLGANVIQAGQGKTKTRLLVAKCCLKCGAPGVTRTPGTQFRKLLLYPPELRGRKDLRDSRARFYLYVQFMCSLLRRRESFEPGDGAA